VLTDNAGNGGGDIFIAPFGDSSTYANGAEILSPDGKKVTWFHPAPDRPAPARHLGHLNAGRALPSFSVLAYR
jgi:hypothetical protein